MDSNVSRNEYDRSLLRLYATLGGAQTYREIVTALLPEIERMLGYKSVWMHLVREGTDQLLLLEAGGTVEEASTNKLIEDDRFRVNINGEDFLVLPMEDPWLAEIHASNDIYITEDARTCPLTNKDIVAITGSRTVVSVPLRLANKTLGSLDMGTFFDEGVLLPNEQQLDYLRQLSNHVAVALDRVRFLAERKQAEEALWRSIEELEFSSFLLDSVMDGVVVRDAEDWTVLYVNEALCRMSGLSREEILGGDDSSPVRGEPWSAIERYLQTVRDTGHAEMETTIDADGTRPVEIRGSMVDYHGRKAILSLVGDISERKTAQATIEHMALHDPLTDLANRALLKDRLEFAMAHARRSQGPLALMFLDVDHFKLINDNAGHGTGDMVLQGVANRLRGIVRAADTVARFGGDEFTLILPYVNSAQAACGVAEKILAALRTPFGAGELSVRSTASIGIAMYECGEETVDEMLRNADLAMYAAKEAGRNTYRVYDPSMSEALGRLSLKQDLDRAIRSRELQVHFQPIVRLSDGKIVGAEALCRWTHPQRGQISPMLFIPLAEESGTICELGEWVLHEACREARRWETTGRALTVSVNLSPRQLWTCDLEGLVRNALGGTKLTPGLLQLEVTETAAVRDAAHLMSAFAALRRLGVRIAIDDFGVGYSSLDYLLRFPLDALKVDRAFVRDVCTDSGCRAIASAIVSLAHDLRLEVIAEGIETDAQRCALMDCACRTGQGFLFSPALPPDEFRALVAT